MIRSLITLLIAASLVVGCSGEVRSRQDQPGDQAAPADHRAGLSRFFKKDSVTIVITDSGLGGLSVAAAIEQQLQKYRVFRNVHLIFANALPDRDHPYNLMETTAEKVKVFDSALAGMSRTLKPDLILIACNTLSVVFPQTEFARSSDIPVIGIVEFGVDQIAQELDKDSSSSVIILGTPTTIGQHTHVDRLVARGFDSTRISTQACNMLETEIQADPTSDIVRSMIELYAMEALEKQPPTRTGELIVALCCSHYGFSRSVFQDVFQSVFERPVVIVDPNGAMAAYLFPQTVRERQIKTSVTTSVVSRAEILPDEAASIAAAVRPVSEATADAVVSYTRDTSLFSF
jgi:glutamate racemase